MDPISSLPVRRWPTRLPLPGSGLRRWLHARRAEQAADATGRRRFRIGLDPVRTTVLAALALGAAACAGMAVLGLELRTTARQFARAALVHVETRIDVVDREITRLSASLPRSDDGSPCPPEVARQLTRASLDSGIVRRFVMLRADAGSACSPEGPVPAPAVAPGVGGSADAGVWWTRDVGGIRLAAELEMHSLAGWRDELPPAARPGSVPARAWTAFVRHQGGPLVERFGAESGPQWVGLSVGAAGAHGLAAVARLDARAMGLATWQRGVAAGLAGVLAVLGAAGWAQRRASTRARLSYRIRQGLRKRQFVPFVQPVIDLQTGRCAGAEVLMRWQHPLRGIVAPGEFIEEAEATGLIVPMSELVMTRAAHRLAPIAQRHPGMYFSFNVTAGQLRQPGFGRQLDEIFRADTLPRDRVMLELTERDFVDAAGSRSVAGLHAEGWRLAIDDFGTGHSSLAALERLVIDRIKIDRAFVRTIDERTVNRPVLDAIIALAEQLGVPLIAEGVETRSQWDYLAARGVGQAQGFLMARPMPVDDFAGWLAGRGEADLQAPAAGATESGVVDAQARALWQRMRTSGGLEVRDRMFHLVNYRQCFVGREAVDWMVRQLGVGRGEAVRFGRRLAALDLVRHVVDEHDFEDAELYFSFCDPDTKSAGSDPATAELRQALRGPAGPQPGPQLRGLLRHGNCLQGRAIVDWIVGQQGGARDRACRRAAQLMRDGALRHVYDDRAFSDDGQLYRIV